MRTTVIDCYFIYFPDFKMTIRPAYRPNIVKKRTKKFIRHQSDRYAKLSVSMKYNLNSPGKTAA